MNAKKVNKMTLKIKKLLEKAHVLITHAQALCNVYIVDEDQLSGKPKAKVAKKARKAKK